MTEEEILEYNKRCAEFLKMEYENHSNTWRYKNEIATQLLFHSDWNWIHEVIEAIEKLYDHPNKEINVDIKPGQIEIFQRPYRLENNDYQEIIYLGDGYINGSKKEAVVEAINQFLIWYNKNK